MSPAVAEGVYQTMPSYEKYRAKLHWLILIDEAIRTGEYPSSQAIAREIELSDRTVRRNIEFMRHVMGAPIAYDSSRKGYHYTDRHWSLPNLRISEGELLGIVLARVALQPYAGTPLGDHVQRLIDKLQARLPEGTEIDPRRLTGLFRFGLGPVTPFRPEHWEQLAAAVQERRTIWMKYHAIYRDEAQEREVDPYLLRCYCGDWYLIGHDHRTGHIPMFNIARIRELRVTRRTFEVQPDFNPEEYFGGTFQVSQRDERHRVRVRFSGVAARLVAEKTWHPSQKLTRKKNGDVVLEMTVSDLDEVASWVLSFGPNARVLGPPTLRQQVAEAADATALMYEGPAKTTKERKKGNARKRHQVG